MRRLLLFSLCLVTLATAVQAGGPGLRGYRKGFVRIDYSGLYYKAIFSPTGSESPVFRNTSNVTLQLYAEYGIAKRWEIRGTLPYKLLQTGSSTNVSANPTPGGSLTGIGNIGLGLKHAVLDGPVKLSMGVDALVNTFTNNDRLGLRTGYEGWTVLPYVSLGAGGKRTYYVAEAGYGLMTQNYSNFLKLNGEFGYQIHPKLWVSATLDIRLSAKNGPFFNTEAYQFTGAYLNDQRYIGVGASASYDLVPDKFGLTASVIEPLAGQNVPFSRAYNAGFFVKW